MRRVVPVVAAGLLAMPAAPASAAEFEVVSRCEWILKTIPDTNQMVLVIVAEAHATGPTPAATTVVECTASTVWNEELVARGASLGPDAHAVSARIMRYDPPTACSSSSALWLDPDAGVVTHAEVEPEHCVP